MNLQKALFLDLDHTLITTRTGRPFPIHYKDWKLIDDTVDLIEFFYKKGYKIIIVTNQGGIEEGYIEENVFLHKIETICKFIEETLNMIKGSISYFYYPKMKGYHRKPNPGMAFEAAIDYELCLPLCIMVGDMDSDATFAYNAGITTYIDVNDVTMFLSNNKNEE